MNKKELKYLQTKLWNLHIEEKEFRENKDYKKILKSISKKANKVLTKKEKKFAKINGGWIQQLGKIIFISGLLGTKDKIRNKVWRIRKWKFKKGKIVVDKKL